MLLEFGFFRIYTKDLVPQIENWTKKKGLENQMTSKGKSLIQPPEKGPRLLFDRKVLGTGDL